MLSIIIVNYNCVPLILDCVKSIYEQTTQASFEIIIVSNSQQANEATLLTETYPLVQWVNMGYNAGFARANNVGIKLAKGDAVLLLNPDTIILDHAIDSCYQRLSNQTYSAAGVQLLNEDKTPQRTGMFAMKGGLNYLLPLPYLGVLFKFLGNITKVKKPSLLDISEETMVDWINGAFLMVKKENINRAGLLDEDFFLYGEEAEWCSRLKETAPIAIFGQLHVLHLQGETANETFNSQGKGYYNLYDKKGRQIIVSNFLRIRKEFGLAWFLIMLCLYIIEIPIFLLLGFLSNLLHLQQPFAHIAKWLGYSKNVLFLVKIAPKMIKARPYFYKVI